MRTHDAADDPLASYQDDPVDHIEPGQEIEESADQRENRIICEVTREAGRKYAKFSNLCSFYRITHHSPSIANWVEAYSLELKPAWGKTLDDIAAICGLGTRQAVAKEVQRFCNATGYRYSVAMKSQRSSAAYREARINSILESQKQ